MLLVTRDLSCMITIRRTERKRAVCKIVGCLIERNSILRYRPTNSHPASCYQFYTPFPLIAFTHLSHNLAFHDVIPSSHPPPPPRSTTLLSRKRDAKKRVFPHPFSAPPYSFTSYHNPTPPPTFFLQKNQPPQPPPPFEISSSSSRFRLALHLAFGSRSRSPSARLRLAFSSLSARLHATPTHEKTRARRGRGR